MNNGTQSDDVRTLSTKSDSTAKPDTLEEELKMLEGAGKTPRRVKVYLLNGDDWIDNGTGFCVGEIDKETKSPYFLVRNEQDTESIILKSFLKGSIQYQRQQETLIVWTDSDGSDLALSFQETEGCADLCDFIIRVQQGNFSPGISLYYVMPNVNEGDDVTELITGPIRYPPDEPEASNIGVVLETVNQGANAQFTRTNILDYIVEKGYFMKLVKVFEQAEKKKDAEALYCISDVIKSLFLYNESSILEDMLSSEEKIMGLVGILEYDSEYRDFKASHRDFLTTQSFTTVIPVDNTEIFKRDFYLNYLKDVVLARFLDEPTFSLLTSLIYANQVEIFNYIKDSSILERLFKIYDDDDNDDDDRLQRDMPKKRDGVKMVHQYVLIAKTLQKLDFFSLLVKSGLLKMINFALKDDEDQIRVLGTELIVIIIEQDVSLVNAIDHEEATIDNSDPPILEELAHALPNDKKNVPNGDTSFPSKVTRLKLSDDMTLISILSKLLVEDRNLGLKNQAFEALKTLLDPHIAASGSNGISPVIGGGAFPGSEEYKFGPDEFKEINTQNYFNAFYAEVAVNLFRKLIDLGNSSEAAVDVKKEDELLYQLLCELISFCTREHKTPVSRTFFLENHIILGVAKLLTANCKIILKLACIRCLKNLISLNDEFYTRYTISQDVWVYFFKFFETVVDENNLANSTCLDFLEIVNRSCDRAMNPNKRTNYVLLAKYIYSKYGDFVRTRLNYVTTGKRLVELVENEFDEVNTNGNSAVHDEDYDEEDEEDEIVDIKTDDLGLSDEEMIPNNASTPINDDQDEEEEEEEEENGNGHVIVNGSDGDDDNVGKKRPREETSEIETSKRAELNEKAANNDNFGQVALTAITSDQL
ncbi:Serine/threonine-protein phosphatase 4 regulatory subunit 3 [Candida viswanathii]|uniref:Serine/threonine-protein phosphatase 4 regulatory subunit 3 n=1 Tax=Candida viswanathii TaxID=5486 RepID=A0A367Y5P1_9ASCO|nr:Serine/threonine-protein phosphatase 4 regulatory subunit 3 [Candida viswanathii]